MLVDSLQLPAGRGVDLQALDDCLTELEAKDRQQARVVDLRYFGGLSIEETAGALSIGTATVKRHWAVARAWLHREIGRHPGSARAQRQP